MLNSRKATITEEDFGGTPVLAKSASPADIPVFQKMRLSTFKGLGYSSKYANFEENFKMVLIENEVLEAARMSEEELKIELAILLYQKGRLSLPQARRLAGVDGITFEELLFEHGVPSGFTVEEFEKDLKTIEKLSKLRGNNQ